MKKVIRVKNLTKKYGKLIAVNNISFDVYQGEIFGLLGENGAGKTTILEMIEGLRKPTSGKIEVIDCDINKELDCVKEKIGVQLQSSAYYQFLTLVEILNLFGSFYNKKVDARHLLEMVDLGEKAGSYVGKLSGGQKQRFSIVASLVNDPEVVFLDEPTTGLDPLARRNLWGLISKIKAQGKTTILTTHYMEEAEILCDRVAIMDKGRILALDDTHRLVKKVDYPYSITFVKEKVVKADFSKLVKLAEIDNLFGRTNQFNLKIKNQKNFDLALDIVRKIKPENLAVGHSTLEDVFIQLTGKTIME